ncbi:MAG: dihydrofolate reductase [Bacteroidales bacterium]|nr:dihydrofolate reductase [Bacteroidales bacterium]
MKKISIIVAVAENNAIGRDNDLLCHLSEDLKRFKKLTTGNFVVMGKRTFESLPRRPLPNRENMVLTDIKDEKIEGCIMAYSIDDAVEKMSNELENFIIGGGSVYSQFLPIANRLYLTKIHASFNADTFFPEIDFSQWNVLEKEDVEKTENDDYSYTYYILERKNL